MPPVLETPGYEITPSTAAAVCGSVSSRTLHFTHLIGRKTGSAKRPVVSASHSHSWRCGKRVTARSCERAGAAWKLTRNRRQATVELRVPSNTTSLVSGAQITSGLNHSTATSGSAAPNYAFCSSSRRHRRKQFFSNSKAEKGAQPLETEITHHGVAACHSQNFIKLAPVNTDNRTRLGMTLERALARALTSSTLSGGRVFLCIFNTAGNVGSILFFHGYAVLFLDRPVARFCHPLSMRLCLSVCPPVDRH